MPATVIVGIAPHPFGMLKTRAPYQTVIRLASGLYILSPGCRLKAL